MDEWNTLQASFVRAGKRVMSTIKKRTTKDLRNIALEIFQGTMYCEEKNHCEIFQNMSTLSHIEALIWETKDIATFIARKNTEIGKEAYDHPIFSEFQTLTQNESLYVLETVLRYMKLSTAYSELTIPSERYNPYI